MNNNEESMLSNEVFKSQVSAALASSAGSGKTFSLTTRLINMLLDGVRVHEIVAITFTKLAANEIRQKLFDRIEKLEKGDRDEVKLFCDIRQDDPASLKAGAEKIRMGLIRYFSLFQVSTIHSFFMKIIKSFPREAGFVDEFMVLEEDVAREFVKKSIENFYQYIAGSDHLLDRIYQFLASYPHNRFTTIKTIEEIYRGVGSQFYALEGLYSVSEAEVQAAEEEHSRARDWVLSDAMRQKIDIVLNIIDEYTRQRGSNRNIQSLVRDLKNFKKYRAVTDLLEVKALKRDRREGPIRYVSTMLKYLPQDSSKLLEDTLAEIRSDLCRYVASRMRYHVLIQLYIYHTIHRCYSRLKKNFRSVDFQDIEILAAALLDRLDDFDYLRYRIDSGARHILIDEFQDTSEIQWRVLEQMVNAGKQTGGSIFYVGDVKQSIYRWRGGSPELFDTVRKKHSLPYRRLGYNYRQNRTVLDFVNRVFESIAEQYPEKYRYEKQYLPPFRRGYSRGFVSIQKCGSREEAADLLVGQIKDLENQGVQLHDMAVLCRKNAEIEQLEKLLRARSIPFNSGGKTRLMEDYSIMDVVNVLKFMLSPWEEIYLSSVLRSPVFRVDYQDLNTLKQEGKISIFSLKRMLPDVCTTLEQLVGMRDYYSPSGIVRRVYENLDLPCVYSSKQSHLLEFYQLACSLENKFDGLTLREFVNYLEGNAGQLTLKTGQESGVTIQTIHSSKGLEYHTVIVPFLDSGFKYRLDNSLLLARDRQGKVKNAYIAAGICRDYLSGTQEVQDAIRQKENDYQTDELNNLYVAVTRACENLVIIPAAGRSRPTVGDVLLEGFDRDYRPEQKTYRWETGRVVPSSPERELLRPGKSYCVSRAGPAAAAPAEEPLSVSPRLAVPRTPEEVPSFASDHRRARVDTLKGLVVHRVLEKISSLPVDEDSLENKIKQALSAEGGAYTRKERERGGRLARSSLLRIVNDSRLQRYFTSDALAEVVSVSGTSSRLLGRMDRMWVSENTVEIIDFKTGEITSSEELDRLVIYYRDQVLSYCSAAAGEFPNKQVRGFLYFSDAPLHQRVVQVYPEEKFCMD
ncbi:MAG: UvrD-helicase domain-containing protein [Spirochaetota bacterium]